MRRRDGVRQSPQLSNRDLTLLLNFVLPMEGVRGGRPKVDREAFETLMNPADRVVS